MPVSPTYPLFQLVRLMSIRDDADNGNSPIVTKYAWKEAGEDNLLALYSTNGYLLLRYASSGKSPTYQQLTWPKEKPICSMCFDPTVTWLLIVTEDATIFIIPARSILDKSARVDQIWSLDDVTITKVKKPKGFPSVVTWWHTLDDQQIAIIGTKSGEIEIIDLIKRCIVTEVEVDASIAHLELIQDDQQMSTFLLITGQAGIQWKLLLESRTSELFKIDLEVSDLGYDQIDGRHLPVISITAITETTRQLFLPLRFYQFQRSVSLSPQNAKGRHFITAYDNKSSTYQVFDSNIEHSPLFVYKLPLGACNIILSDKTIYTTTRLAGEKKLLVIANQKAETSIEDQKEFNKDAVLQHFDLPVHEKLLTVVKKSFPFYWHDKREENFKQQMARTKETGLWDHSEDKILRTYGGAYRSFEIQINGHTVLNGCLVITDSAVYELRPRVSPERLFLDLALGKSDASITDNLGISLGLDINTLYELSAENCVQNHSYERAIKLFKMAKSSFLRRVSCFAKHGCVQEVMSHLKQALGDRSSDVTTVEKKQLSNLMVYCYVYLLKHNAEDQHTKKTFLEFLVSNFFYDEQNTLSLLAENNLDDVLLEVAKSRGLVMEALSLLAKNNHFLLQPDMIQGLVAKGFTNHLIQSSKGIFLEFMTPHSLVDLLCSKPDLALPNHRLLQPVLSKLDVPHLETLAKVFDPSRNPLRGHLCRYMGSRHRTASISSVSSDAESGILDGGILNAGKLVEFFLSVVLHLNRRREENGHVPTVQELMSVSTSEAKQQSAHHAQNNNPSPRRRHLSFQPRPIGSGPQHVGVVRNGELYTWGRTSQGRLGHGDLALENTVSPPCRVETLHMLQIKVLSVSCGGEHTMALTQQGVYGWGSSKYGQVGTGTTHIYSRPMLIEALSTAHCVDIVCGQYHTLALTAEADVYSWGWGVHGQLGHGNVEDAVIPTKVKALTQLHVTHIQAGYCHSVVLTEQGTLYSFGCGFFGQLGSGNNKKTSVPLKVDTLPEKITIVATRYFHNVAVSQSNKVYTWGCHPYNLRFVAHAARKARQAGKFMGDPVERFLLPEVVDTGYVHGRITKVAVGSSHGLLMTLDGDLYSWGRNAEGQIGNNSKYEMINDRQMAHLSSGGEFNVTMDTEGLVWVWGKNDFGQLGMDKVDGSSPTSVKHSRIHTHHRHRETFTPVNEVLVPTVCAGIPPAKPAGRIRHTSLSRSDSFDSSEEHWAGTERFDSRHLDKLPDLQTLTETKYNRLVILEVLENLSEFCHCVQFLRRCVDLKDWLSAVYVGIHKQNYSQALAFHLSALKKYKRHYSMKFKAIVSAIINLYIQLCVKQDLPAGQKEENYRILIMEVLQLWEAEQLETVDLEKLLTPYLDHLSCILSVIIFWPRTDNDPSAGSKFTFSTKFSMTVLQNVVKKIQSVDFEKKHPICHQAYQPFTMDTGEGHSLDLQPSEKMIPYQQLWQDVVQNLQKGAESQQFIAMTRSEVDHLDEKLHSNPSCDTGATNHNSVLFTCGHYYTKQTFLEEVLVKFQRELAQGPASLPSSAQVLVKYYSRGDLLPLACPKCVLNALHSMGN
uniref:Uncharacterized protein LOC111106775 isoform X2 n=1 Tax=Crassostrea virginica TaxID=6565 RepID=A0A8B8B1W5_CRAVI|nr:uncharacterized protein LOC111106775 isoform X2 [Crassostrea virginica]